MAGAKVEQERGSKEMPWDSNMLRQTRARRRETCAFTVVPPCRFDVP